VLITAGSGATEEAASWSNSSFVHPVSSEVEHALLGAFETIVMFESIIPTDATSTSVESFLKSDSSSDDDRDVSVLGALGAITV
jgi:hypothetical protein